MIQPTDSSRAVPEGMRYGMIVGEGATSEEKLEKYTGVVDWSYLKPHYESGALLWVDPSVRITEVGMGLIEDEKAKVQGWLSTGDLIKPSEPHAAQWENSKENFLCCVVSPFVLIQPPAAA